MLNDKKYVDEKMGSVIDEVSQEMIVTARYFVYHYCRIDFDDMTAIVEQPAIDERSRRIQGLVEGDVFLYDQLVVSTTRVRPGSLADGIFLRLTVLTLASSRSRVRSSSGWSDTCYTTAHTNTTSIFQKTISDPYSQ